MARKRKGATRSATEDTSHDTSSEPVRKRIRTFEDVADSEDEFHINQDRILLDESSEARRKRRAHEHDAFLQQSDEEVLGAEEDDLEDSEGSSPRDEADQDSDEAEEEEEAWGTSRADLYGADAIETEEQAIEEEAEALRLQKKQLQKMTATDYGFDEAEWQDMQPSTQIGQPVVKETLAELPISQGMSVTERQKLLSTRYPEFEPLKRELIILNALLAINAEELQAATTPRPNLQVQYQALSAYVGSLAMYFVVLTSGSVTEGDVSLMPAAQLRDHEVMSTMVRCRRFWQSVEDLPEDKVELEQKSLTEDIPSLISTPKGVSASVDKKKSSRKERHAKAAEDAKNARIAERLERIEADFAKLGARLGEVHPRASRQRVASDDSDAGEEAQLTAAQAEEKAKKRKSLRFYTSQIAQKANKRSTAGRNAGGDDDVPHRERLRDRQARLNAEAEKRGKRSGTGHELGGASDEEDAMQARQIRNQAEDDNYYDMVAAQTSKKKSDKAALAQRLAAEQGGRVVEEEALGADGKRKITYAIEKNKGLTPHRSKDVRNPRVKKRKKYEQKTKKLASMKPVYKGGEGRGGYGGELTGIKSNLVRSVKL